MLQFAFIFQAKIYGKPGQTLVVYIKHITGANLQV